MIRFLILNAFKGIYGIVLKEDPNYPGATIKTESIEEEGRWWDRNVSYQTYQTFYGDPKKLVLKFGV